MIVFTDANYSGSLPTSKIVTKSYILHVRRVLHPSLSEMHVTHNLMQDSVRDFSISNVNIGVGSTGPQLLEGRCWGKGSDFFQGGGGGVEI